MKNLIHLLLFTTFAQISTAQDSFTVPDFAPEYDYTIVLGETVTEDGVYSRPSEPKVMKFHKYIQEGQKYMKITFSDGEHDFELPLALEKIEDKESYIEYYVYSGLNDEERKAKFTYFKEQRSVVDLDVDFQVEFFGYWGKLKYNLFFDLKMDNLENLMTKGNHKEVPEKSPMQKIHDELTELFISVETGFENKKTKILNSNEQVTSFETSLSLASLEDIYILTNPNTKTLFHAASLNNNPAQEQELLKAMFSYTNANYKIIPLKSGSLKMEFAVEKNSKIIGFIEYGLDSQLSRNHISFILRTSINSNKLIRSIKEGLQILKDKPELLMDKLVSENEKQKRYQVPRPLFDAKLSYLLVLKTSNTRAWSNAYMHCSFDAMKYILLNGDLELTGIKTVETLKENFLPSDDPQEIKVLYIQFKQEKGTLTIALTKVEGNYTTLDLSYSK